MLNKIHFLKFGFLFVLACAGAIALAHLFWLPMVYLWFGIAMFLAGVISTLGLGIFLIARQVGLLSELIEEQIELLSQTAHWVDRREDRPYLAVYRLGTMHVISIGEKGDRFVQINVQAETITFHDAIEYASTFESCWNALKVLSLCLQRMNGMPELVEEAIEQPVSEEEANVFLGILEEI